MSVLTTIRSQLHVHRRFGVQFVGIIVGLHGMFILASILLDQLAARHGTRLTSVDIDLPLIIGLSLLYVSTLLRRHKQTAWWVAIVIYVAYLAVGVHTLSHPFNEHAPDELAILRSLIVPFVVVGTLIYFRREFVVRSDIPGFRNALKFSATILLVTLLYGVVGLKLLDQTDFHEEIGVATAAHYTVDQFDLTTVHSLHPYTKRAHLFVESLPVVSSVAIAYAILSLFQPLRSRYSDQTHSREQLAALLHKYHGLSEDFFKLWPHDKQYFFDASEESGLAFHVSRGVALCLGDPAGKSAKFAQLLQDFAELCYVNDWLPAHIHARSEHRRLYERNGYLLQKIGQEAIVDISHFQASVTTNKYFRHIRNKFSKLGYAAEMLYPPHHAAIVERLQIISEDWLGRDGRTERGFVMGYFSDDYLAQCAVMVARDAAGTIQAFVTQVPAEFDSEEATFDMLRHTSHSPGNINDFLMTNFIATLAAADFSRLNLGLCPLVGLSEGDGNNNMNLIDSVLRFAYANGDRFYSFGGLHRYKSKYEPEWRDRYIVYKGGVRGFSKTMTSLMRAMRVKTKSAH